MRVRFSYVNKYYKELVDKHKIKLDSDLQYFSKTMYLRPRNNYDVYFAVTSDEGVGKSNFMITMGYLNDPDFDLEKNILYSPNINELKTKIEYRKIEAKGETPPKEALKPFQFINIDEAIKIVYKLEQWSGVSRFLKKLMALARVENKIVGLCIPDFLDMGNVFRSRMIWWVHVYHRDKERAYCVVLGKSPNIFAKDKWNMKDNYNLFEQGCGRGKYADLTPTKKLAAFRRTKNYVIDFTVPLLPSEIWDRYEKLKLLHSYDDIEDEKSGGKRYLKTLNNLRIAVRKIKEDNPKLRQKDIGRMFGVAQNTISEWLKDE